MLKNRAYVLGEGVEYRSGSLFEDIAPISYPLALPRRLTLSRLMDEEEFFFLAEATSMHICGYALVKTQRPAKNQVKNKIRNLLYFWNILFSNKL